MSGSASEGGNGDNQTAEINKLVNIAYCALNTKKQLIPSSDRLDAKSHQTSKTELPEEDQEKQHEVEAGVRSEGFVGGPEPAEE